MKKLITFITLFLFALISCDNSSDKLAMEPESNSPKLVNVDTSSGLELPLFNHLYLNQIKSDTSVTDTLSPIDTLITSDTLSNDTLVVDNELTFSKAFVKARKEIGVGGLFIWRGEYYNTYYLEEWDKLSYAEKNTKPKETHDILIAENIVDDMTFDVAFNTARKSIGQGGIFYWNGSYYNTYNVEEWNNLSDEFKGGFISKVKKLKELSLEKELSISLVKNLLSFNQTQIK